MITTWLEAEEFISSKDEYRKSFDEFVEDGIFAHNEYIPDWEAFAIMFANSIIEEGL